MVIVVVASLVLGALTSHAQGVLPGPLRPFANSASGWTVLIAFIVWRIGARTLPSAVFGLASFVALVLGSGFLAGIAIGECLYGLIVVSGTTGWFYWACRRRGRCAPHHHPGTTRRTPRTSDSGSRGHPRHRRSVLHLLYRRWLGHHQLLAGALPRPRPGSISPDDETGAKRHRLPVDADVSA